VRRNSAPSAGISFVRGAGTGLGGLALKCGKESSATRRERQRAILSHGGTTLRSVQDGVGDQSSVDEATGQSEDDVEARYRALFVIDIWPRVWALAAKQRTAISETFHRRNAKKSVCQARSDKIVEKPDDDDQKRENPAPMNITISTDIQPGFVQCPNVANVPRDRGPLARYAPRARK